MTLSERCGIVVIGRNEGERLRLCLESCVKQATCLIYVDSGSTDGSVDLARRFGAHVVELDRAHVFTAARARNCGLARLRDASPNLEFVQFVDGDCEIVESWLPAAIAFLDSRLGVAAVCGRRRERNPERSIYNRLCDQEWNTPLGESRFFGGDVTMRIAPIVSVGGYRESLIAGEDPELSVRLRAAGWQIWRIDEDMTLHDAAMVHFRQWWRRATRAGYAFAEGALLHGRAPERHWVWESVRSLAWGVGLPIAALVTAFSAGPWWGALVASLYPVQVLRLSLSSTGDVRDRWYRAFFLTLDKFPAALGQLQFLRDRLLGRKSGPIEYK